MKFKLRRRWTLADLDAEWIPTKGRRYNCGFSFVCPRHASHRLRVRFSNPYDGDPPIDGPGLLVYMVSNGSLAQVTLVMAGTDDGVLQFGLCGKLRIIDGMVELA